MHEFGHNLGLRHGGGDNINCKPNYLSIMSYTRQMPTIIPTSNYKIDYSHIELDPLNETSLNEKRGITSKLPEAIDAVIPYGPILNQFTFVNEPTDFDYDTKFEPSVQQDINKIPIIKACQNSFGQVLNSYDDWDNLIFIADQSQFGTTTNGTLEEGLDTTNATSEEELTFEDVQGHDRFKD